MRNLCCLPIPSPEDVWGGDGKDASIHINLLLGVACNKHPTQRTAPHNMTSEHLLLISVALARSCTVPHLPQTHTTPYHCLNCSESAILAAPGHRALVTRVSTHVEQFTNKQTYTPQNSIPECHIYRRGIAIKQTVRVLRR